MISGYKLAFNYLKAKKYIDAIDVCHKVSVCSSDIDVTLFFSNCNSPFLLFSGFGGSSKLPKNEKGHPRQGPRFSEILMLEPGPAADVYHE